jgi:hypothetical protein
MCEVKKMGNICLVKKFATKEVVSNPTFSQRIFSLTNYVAKFFGFALCEPI